MPGLDIGVALGARLPRRGFDFSAGVLPSGATLTRASGGSYVEADGSMAWAGVDVPRFDHDPASGRRHGLLLEPEATNLIPHSHALSSAPWAGDAGGGGTPPVVESGVSTAPDGSGAVRMTFARGEGYSRYSIAAGPVDSGLPAVFSVWLKSPFPGASVALRCDSVDGETLMLTSQWQRFSLSTLGSGDFMSCQILLWAAIAGSPASAIVDAWGAQMEQDGQASSLIPTAGTSVTRAADHLTLDWASRGIADGARTVRFIFGDGSIAEVATVIAGGTAAVPVPLSRRWLVRADAF